MWSEMAEQTVRRLIATQPPADARVKHQAHRLGALFVGWDLFSCWFLRPSGEVVIVDEEDLDRPRAETAYLDREHILSALSGASRLYPELSELLSEREPGAVDCGCIEHPQFFGPGKVICPACGGMGWLPPPSPERRS
jgi:hypothetical protein